MGNSVARITNKEFLMTERGSPHRPSLLSFNAGPKVFFLFPSLPSLGSAMSHIMRASAKTKVRACAPCATSPARPAHDRGSWKGGGGHRQNTATAGPHHSGHRSGTSGAERKNKKQVHEFIGSGTRKGRTTKKEMSQVKTVIQKRRTGREVVYYHAAFLSRAGRSAAPIP